MGKLGFFKGMLRANSKRHGDLQGSMLPMKGKAPVSIVDGLPTAWAVGMEDFTFSKENVASCEKITDDVVVTDIANSGGQPVKVNVYSITMKNGKSGTLRLARATEWEILQHLK